MFIVIILNILKYTAYVILIILAAALIITLLILAAPLSYKVVAYTGEKTCVNVKARWLYGILSVKYLYKNNASDNQVYLFNWKLKNEPKQVKKDETRHKPKNEKFHKSDAVNFKKTVAKRDKHTPEAEVKTKTNFLSVFKHYPDKKLLISKTILLIKRLIKKIKPKFFKLSGEIGFDTPHYTGYLLAVAGIVRGLKGVDIDITPNMEGRVFDIALKTNGRVSLLSLCAPVAAYAAARPVRRIIRTYMKAK